MRMLIRADASTDIGTGHMMRCLALAQAWQENGGTAHFASASITPALNARLGAENMGITRLDALPGSAEDAAQTIALAERVGADWIVTDGYQFDALYQKAVKEAGLRLMFVDDYGHARHYWADLVLNQNVYANATLYSNRETYTSLLMGTRYVLLRREFRPWKNWTREIPPVACKVLVTLGGTDSGNVMSKVVQALERLDIDGLEAMVVLGGSNLHAGYLQHTSQSPQIRFVYNASDMPTLMAWADVAVSAGGTTSWELAFMGLPSMLITLVNNQRLVAQGLHEAGAAQYLGSYGALSSERIAGALKELLVDAQQRTRMSGVGSQLVDGRGGERILMALRGAPVTLRPASEDDCELLWQWANDPDTRASSFSSASTPWGEHVEWFRSKLKSPDSAVYIAFDDHGLPVGQVRYDISDGEATISLSVDRRFRGQGYGKLVIQAGCDEVFSERFGVKVVHAYVRPDNEASIHAFLKAGFDLMGSSSVRGHRAIHLTRRRDKTLAENDAHE